MAVAALKLKPKLKTFHATVHVTRVEEWCVEAETVKRRASCWLQVTVTGARSATA